MCLSHSGDKCEYVTKFWPMGYNVYPVSLRIQLGMPFPLLCPFHHHCAQYMDASLDHEDEDHTLGMAEWGVGWSLRIAPNRVTIPVLDFFGHLCD